VIYKRMINFVQKVFDRLSAYAEYEAIAQTPFYIR